MYDLFHRIEQGAQQYPDRTKARMFTDRSRPELSLVVSPFMSDTLEDAVNRAKAFELTYSRGGSLSAYSAQQKIMPGYDDIQTMQELRI